MTEYASHHPCHRDEGRRHIPKSSSSNLSTSRRLGDSYSDSRILVQTMDKTDNRGKSYPSVSKEVNKRNLSTSGDKHYKRNIDEKPNGFIPEDYKIARKPDIRPSDSSYTRKLSWDTNNFVETPSLARTSKSHQVREIKQDCHVAPKHSYNKTVADNHKKKSDSFHIDKRQTVENDPSPSYFTHLSELGHLNGISHDSQSNSLPFYQTVDQMVNGYGHSKISHPLSRDSSHLQSLGPEASNPHKRKPGLEKLPSAINYLSPVQSQNHKSPALNYVPYTNSSNENSAASSQITATSQESSSRPNSSFWGEEESSNDNKSLAVNLSNPTTAVASTPEKPRYPYSIEMKEGMFRTVKVGPDHETLRIHIIENFGSGDLRDGGFSWGWSIERRSSAQPSPKTSSASRDKNSSSANKDVLKSKRRLEYEKTSSSPTLKRSRPKINNSEGRETKGNNSEGREMKGNNLEGREAKGNTSEGPKMKGNNSDGREMNNSEGRDTKNNSLKVSEEKKEIKSKYRHVSPPKYPSPHMTQPYGYGEKPAAKTLKPCDAIAEGRKSMSAGKYDRHGGHGISPIEKQKSPIYVPSSEMIQHLPKTDCLGKSNNVIDDSTMGFISSKKERSAIYSGRKSALEVLPLKLMCFEAVKKNILSIKIGRNVPFELLMPALILCSPSKLHRIEEHNRHILRYTDSLWKKFCESEFRVEKRLNGEPWKDVYWRARNSREKKLKNLAASISNGMSKAHPERQAKWVGVGVNNPEKRQRKKTVEEVHRTEEIPIPKPEANGKGSNSSHKEPPVKKRSGSESSSSNSPQSAQKPTILSKSLVPKAAKKTLAPLMSKTKKMLNLVNRRR